MKKYLLIAHFDGDKSTLVETLRELAQAGPASFRLIVPATPPPTEGWAWTEQEAYAAAQQRMETTLAELKPSGADLTGEILNYSELGALDEALQKDSYDELIVATPPDSDARIPFEEFERHVQGTSKIPIRHLVAEGAKPVERG